MTEAGREAYIPTLREEKQRRTFESYFSRRLPFYEGKQGGEVREKATGIKEEYSGRMPRIETGIVEIPLGGNARRGDVCYSGEIMPVSYTHLDVYKRQDYDDLSCYGIRDTAVL